ncbi:efflux RND transporter permease subunit [Gimesia chilikensis]|uniref:efflux RND transporter permease subunit n=1 Tax=Gimesia chilikensis TaxID=2605989 RepID=UPI00118BEFE9|nr:MMPL family transporter [Gimesia chilikensis]MCR9234379.1 MMPL family transporter [bacterium]QDT82969.1 Membrane protein YdfJ [Gimesia chilikensis]
MASFFEKRDPWGHSLSLWVVVLMIFITPVLFGVLREIRQENNVENWLPPDDPQSKVLQWHRDSFGIEDRVLVSWDGSSLTDLRADRLKQSLLGQKDAKGVRRGGSPYILDVATPQDAIQKMVDYHIDPDEAERRLKGVLIGTGMLKVRLSPAGKKRREQTIQELIATTKRELGIDLTVKPAFTPWVEMVDETEEGTVTDAPVEEPDEDQVDFKALVEAIPEHDFQLIWPRMQAHSKQADQIKEIALSLRRPEILVGASTAADQEAKSDQPGEEPKLIEDCFFAIGTPIAVAISLSDTGDADHASAVAAIKTAAVDAGIPAENLHMGGRPVAGAALNRMVKESSWNTAYPLWQFHKRSVTLFSGLIGIALAFLMLRSVRLACLVLLVSYYTTFVAVSIIPMTGGTMNMVLVVMPTLLTVLTLSGSIHVANYWKHAAHVDMKTAVVKAVEMARAPCMMASLTTAIGLASLLTSPLSPVRDFGLYASIGCVVSLLMVLYGLPSLLQLWPAKPPKASEIDTRHWQAFGRGLSRHQWLVSFSCLAIFVAACYGFKWFRTETKVIRYFPDSSRVIQDYLFLEENLSGITPVDTVICFDEKAQEDLNFEERVELVRNIERKIAEHPEISGTISLADFRPVSEPLPKDASTFQKLRHAKRVNETERRVRESLKKEKSGEVNLEGDTVKSFLNIADHTADLEQETANGARMVDIQKGDEMWRITAQVAIMTDLNYADLTNELNQVTQSVLRDHAGTTHLVTGTIPLFLRTQQAVLESLIKSFGLAFAVIAVVMMVLLRSPTAGLITMLPNLMPIGVIFGLLSWMHVAVDIGTMITASVALGIAVDGTLHLLTWFKIGIEEGKSKSEAVAAALGHCGPAMWQTSAVVAISLAMLYPAELLLVSRFGILMCALITAALLADIIFLPALLAGPLGTLIVNSQKREQKATEKHPLLQEGKESKPHLSHVVKRAQSEQSFET